MPAAKECGIDVVTAYIVSSSDERVIESLPAALNPPRRAQSHDERVQHAIRAIEFGLTIEEASHRFSISRDVIYNEQTKRQIAFELEKLGIKTTGMSKQTILELGRIKNTNVLAPAARLVAAAKLTGPETSAFSQQIRKERTEAQQIAVVAAKEKELGIDPANAKHERSPAKRTPATSVKMCMSQLESLMKVRTINQWGITDKHEKEQFIERANNLCKRFVQILKRSS
jgi:hypothetical protein